MYTIDWNTVVLVLVAVMNAATLYYSRHTEKNTNSMKDALIISTRAVAHQAGREEMRTEAATTAAAILAEGNLAGKKVNL